MFPSHDQRGEVMIIKKCDGKDCGKMSPDELGLHVANHWYEVSVKKVMESNDNRKNIILCKDCIKEWIKP